LNESHPKNLIYSPFSLSAVVAMARLGAKGTTAQEITRTLRYPVDDNVLGKGYSKILASLQVNFPDHLLGFLLLLLAIGIGFHRKKADIRESCFSSQSTY
jgi:hypothetical protein